MDDDDTDVGELAPISLGMPILKELGAKWLVEMSEHISNNPQFIVRGFIKSGITDAIDGITSTESSEELEEALNSEEEYTDEESDGGEESDNEGSESEEGGSDN